MASGYPPQKDDTTIQLLEYYERYLIRQQEQQTPLKVQQVKIVKIKEGDTRRYLTDTDWTSILDEADSRCIICTNQILKDDETIHSACACKPHPVIHASCMLALHQRGEREVNGKESNAPVNDEKKKQSSYVLTCAWCNTPYLGKISMKWYQHGLAIYHEYKPERSYDVVVKGFESFFSGDVLLVGLAEIQNVLKTILIDWKTSSDYNPMLGKVLAVLSRMHLKYVELGSSEQHTSHDFLGRICMVAAINVYGPGMTVWNVNTVQYLMRLCCEVYATSKTVNPLELAAQCHTISVIIRYSRRVETSAPESWQVALRQKVRDYLVSTLTELTENDVFFQEWLLPCSDLEMEGAEEKTTKMKQGGLTESKQHFLDSMFCSSKVDCIDCKFAEI